MDGTRAKAQRSLIPSNASSPRRGVCISRQEILPSGRDDEQGLILTTIINLLTVVRKRSIAFVRRAVSQTSARKQAAELRYFSEEQAASAGEKKQACSATCFRSGTDAPFAKLDFLVLLHQGKRTDAAENEIRHRLFFCFIFFSSEKKRRGNEWKQYASEDARK